MMKIAAVCCTYRRPKLLGVAIQCFLDQTHPDRKLVILDDAGQYEPQKGDRWELFSQSERFPSLGAKRNAAVALALADPEVQGLAVMDDDDWYFPHWLERIAAALEAGPWCGAKHVYVEHPPGQLVRFQTVAHNGHWFHHPTWGFRRELFSRLGGYSTLLSHGEDQELFGRALASDDPPVDALEGLKYPPYFVYEPSYPEMNTYHISRMNPAKGYEELARIHGGPVAKATLAIGRLRDFASLPVRPEIKSFVNWGASPC
jgi:glycosyltransferase involved in cell wall biosynthesis